MDDPQRVPHAPSPTRTTPAAPTGSGLIWVCAVVFVVALGCRAGLGCFTMARLPEPNALTFPDEQQYWALAQSLHEGRGLIGELGHRTDRMPLYPAMLSPVAGLENGVVIARVGQWIVGALGAVAVAWLGCRLGSWRAGVLAGLITACDPGLVGSAGLLLTETVFVTLVAWWWLIGWPLGRHGHVARWPAVGVLAAAAVYARPSALILVPLWSVWVWGRRRFAWRAAAGPAFVIAFVVLSLVPWGYRNRHVTGHWCWLTTRAGISLYDGVRPGATGASDLGDVKESPAVRGLSEHAWDRYFSDAAWQAMRDDPVRIIRLGLVKLARTWSPFLHADELGAPAVRFTFAAWSILFYSAVGLGLWARRKHAGEWTGLLLPAVMICVLHFFYVGSVRYRLGAIPALSLLAAFGVLWAMRRVFGGRDDGQPA
ncbi:MAG: glycosyltransferase family 39 protein [Phycisphaerae bacterium]|nr:glycosyltransferase family 39 protein [Phycisphaerae bacterium]